MNHLSGHVSAFLKSSASFMKKTTILDVAARAGVSNATVSAVLNDRGTVNEHTRRRVLEALDALHYRGGNAARRRPRASGPPTIGLLVKEVDNPYFADIYLGACEVVHRSGYAMFIASSENSVPSEHEMVDLFASHDIDGLIISPLLNDESDLSHLFELKRRNIPFVMLESVIGLQASIVDVDNVTASKRAVQHLIEQGHVRIVHFAGPRSSMHSEERIEGFRRAFSESDLVFREEAIVHTGSHLQHGYDHGLAYFRAHRDVPPTAVTCYNDLVAIGLMRALREQGLRIPQDVSVVGYDDIGLVAFLPTPLTTVRVPKVEMGARAAELLLRQIEGGPERTAPPIERLILHAELIVRASTAPPGTDTVAS